MANHINDEKKNFNSYITNKIFDLPMDSHNKIMYHFLHGSLQSSEVKINCKYVSLYFYSYIYLF